MVIDVVYRQLEEPEVRMVPFVIGKLIAAASNFVHSQRLFGDLSSQFSFAGKPWALTLRWEVVDPGAPGVEIPIPSG